MSERRKTSTTPSAGEAQPSGFLAGLNALETVIVAVIALVALAGLLMIAKGLILKSDGALFGSRPAIIGGMQRA